MARMNKQDMIDYLMKHSRYWTQSSINESHSYAANVKVRGWVPNELMNRAYDMLEIEEVFEVINDECRVFESEHGHPVGFNGRSGGYMVLYNNDNTCTGLDQGADFDFWTCVELRERVKLVKAFDRLVDGCKEIFLGFCRQYEVVEEEIMVPKTIKVLKDVEPCNK